MKNRQYTVKVFETSIEDEDQFIDFFDMYQTLFKDHLILINGKMSERIRTYLETHALSFVNNVTLPSGRPRKSIEEEFSRLKAQEKSPDDCHEYQEKIEVLETENAVNQKISQAEITKLTRQISQLSNKLENNLTVMDTMVRSGRELRIEGDLLLLNRVNSGAKIHTTGNLIVTQVVEGDLICDGNFMMVTVSPKANIIFNGVLVDNALLENKLNRIALVENEIIITPVIKKEINWVT